MTVFIRRVAAAGPLAWAVLLLGLAAAVLMVMTEFTTIHSVRLGDTTCGAADAADRNKCLTSGGDQHGYTLLLLAAVAALMTVGAVVGRSRPAAIALGVVGLVVLFVALVLDLPSLDSTRGLEARYSNVSAQTGGAFKLELIAGALALLAGALAFVRLRDDGAAPERARARGGDPDAEAAGSSP
jgi:hypothetical protein